MQQEFRANQQSVQLGDLRLRKAVAVSGVADVHECVFHRMIGRALFARVEGGNCFEELVEVIVLQCDDGVAKAEL